MPTTPAHLPPATLDALPAWLDRYDAQPAEVAHVVQGWSDAMFRHRPDLARYPDAGQWSAIELLAHLADTELAYVDRMQRAIAMAGTDVLGFDGQRYAPALHYQERDPRMEMDFTALIRRRMATILRRMPAEAWAQTVMHNEAGRVSLFDLLQIAVRHADHHAAFLGRKHRAG